MEFVCSTDPSLNSVFVQQIRAAPGSNTIETLVVMHRNRCCFDLKGERYSGLMMATPNWQRRSMVRGNKTG